MTVHDLLPIRYPDTHPGDRVEELRKRLPAAIASASAVIVDSDFVRREVIGHFGVNPDRVTAIHLGVPRDGDALREAMLRLIEDEKEVRRRVELGHAQAARFTWRACAEKTLAVYREALQAAGQK